jgi:hypothetical protein
VGNEQGNFIGFFYLYQAKPDLPRWQAAIGNAMRLLACFQLFLLPGLIPVLPSVIFRASSLPGASDGIAQTVLLDKQPAMLSGLFGPRVLVNRLKPVNLSESC